MPEQGYGSLKALTHRAALRWLFDNPVTLKELRGRMRGARAFVVLTVYLLLLGAFTSLIYLAMAESAVSAGGQVSVGQIGRTLFGGVVGIELLLVAFIAPSFTSGTISGEREHQTLDLLRTTLLPVPLFVVGKLLSAMLYVLLMLLAAIPLQSIAFFFGGVAETEILLSFVVLAVTALLFSAIGLWASARSQRTLTANVLTYGAVLFILFGIPLLWAAVMAIVGFTFPEADSSRAGLAMLYISGAILSTNPAIAAVLTQYFLVNRRTVGLFSYTFSSGDTITLISPWIPFTVIYVLVTLILLLLAVRRLHRMTD